MSLFKRGGLVSAIFLLFILIPACQQKEDVTRVNLDERTSDVSLFKKTIDTGNSLTFCFDLRLSPSEDVEIYGSLMDYLEKETGLDFILLFLKDYNETIENIGTGRAQFAIIGGLSYIKAEHDYGVKMLVKGLCENGKGSYRAAIITKKTSSLNELSRLKGKSFAFGSKLSTQGHLIPRYMLEQEGVLLADLSKYFYTGSHWNCAIAVINGEAAAGGIQDTLAFNLEEEGNIKILALSDYYPRSGIAVNKDVPEQTAEKVKKALLQFEPLGKHKEVVINWSKTEMPGGFTEVFPQDYDILRRLAVKYNFLGE